MERARERASPARSASRTSALAELDELLAEADTPPVVNQVQFSPFKFRRACSQRARSARSCSRPTARWAPVVISRPARPQIAERVGRTPAQVLLRWCVQRDLVVLPKSTHRERIEENAAIFDFALSDEDMAALDALDKTGGTGAALEQNWW